MICSYVFRKNRVVFLTNALNEDAPYLMLEKASQNHWVKSVRIQSYSGPCFPAFGLNTERYFEYGHFSCSVDNPLIAPVNAKAATYW